MDCLQQIPELWSRLRAHNIISPRLALRAVEALGAWGSREPDAGSTILRLLRSILATSIEAANAQRTDPTSLEVPLSAGGKVKVPLVILPVSWAIVFEEAAVQATRISGSSGAALAVIQGSMRLGAWPTECVAQGVYCALHALGDRQSAARVVDAAPFLALSAERVAVQKRFRQAGSDAVSDSSLSEADEAVLANLDDGAQTLLRALNQACRPLAAAWNLGAQRVLEQLRAQSGSAELRARFTRMQLGVRRKSSALSTFVHDGLDMEERNLSL